MILVTEVTHPEHSITEIKSLSYNIHSILLSYIPVQIYQYTMNSLNDQAFLHSYNLKESEAAEMVNKVNYALTLHI